MVLQDVFLFSDSIFNNITLRDPKISREKVIEAAKKVGEGYNIIAFPEGTRSRDGKLKPFKNVMLCGMWFGMI